MTDKPIDEIVGDALLEAWNRSMMSQESFDRLRADTLQAVRQCAEGILRPIMFTPINEEQEERSRVYGGDPTEPRDDSDQPAERPNGAPEGWKLMPPEPTRTMQDAWDSAPFNEDCDEEFQGAYRAMLDAAPTQSTQQSIPPADDWSECYPAQQPDAGGHRCAACYAAVEQCEGCKRVDVGRKRWQPDAGEPVGYAYEMPGASDFTMACFEAATVPVGTPLHTIPAPQVAQTAEGEPEWIDDPHDIEQGMMRNPKYAPPHSPIADSGAIANALRSADWSGVSIGNKGLIQTAIIALAAQPKADSGEEGRIDEINAIESAQQSDAGEPYRFSTPMLPDEFLDGAKYEKDVPSPQVAQGDERAAFDTWYVERYGTGIDKNHKEASRKAWQAALSRQPSEKNTKVNTDLQALADMTQHALYLKRDRDQLLETLHTIANAAPDSTMNYLQNLARAKVEMTDKPTGGGDPAEPRDDSDRAPAIRENAPFYFLKHAGSIFIREGAQFRAQGGLTEKWGEVWRPVYTANERMARAIAEREVSA